MHSKSEYSPLSNPTKKQTPQLSSYTIASNCTDITDLKDAIEEIKDAIQIYTRQGERAPSYFFVRLNKLEDKLKRKQTKSLVHLSVTTRFAVDIAVLKMAIQQCFQLQVSPTKENVIKTIKNTVKLRGSQILDSLEEWDANSNSVNDTEVLKALQNLRQEFNL